MPQVHPESSFGQLHARARRMIVDDDRRLPPIVRGLRQVVSASSNPADAELAGLDLGAELIAALLAAAYDVWSPDATAPAVKTPRPGPVVTVAPEYTPTIRAWYVVQGFVDEVHLCECGMIYDALRFIYDELGRYPAWGAGSRPGEGDPATVFAAYTLDSWGLLTHYGSVTTGCFRTEDKGEALYQALRLLTEADEEFLPDWSTDVKAMGALWSPHDPPPGLDVPWWQRGTRP